MLPPKTTVDDLRELGRKLSQTLVAHLEGPIPVSVESLIIYLNFAAFYVDRANRTRTTTNTPITRMLVEEVANYGYDPDVLHSDIRKYLMKNEGEHDICHIVRQICGIGIWAEDALDKLDTADVLFISQLALERVICQNLSKSPMTQSFVHTYTLTD